MARLRPQDVPHAGGIVLHDLLPLLDERVVRASVESVLVREEDRIRVGELPDDAPLREIVASAPGPRPEVGLVVPDDIALRVEARQQRAHLFGLPREVEVPAREQYLCVGVVAVGAIEEHVECLDLELEVLLPVRVAHPLAKADCVEQPRSGRVLAVRIDRDFRHLPVFVRPLRVADVPDLPVALAVLSVGKREERRILLVEEVLGRARIPVRHRAEVLRHHQPAVEGVLLQPAPQLAPVLEAPEQRAVVVSRSRAGEPLRGIGVFAHVGERPLEQVVLPDTEHQHVEAALERPVDLALPVPGSPVLGLEAREAAVREVAYAAVLEVRLLVDVEAGEVDGFALRHDVAVPEPVASATTFEKVVEPVPHASHVRAGNGDGGSRGRSLC